MSHVLRVLVRDTETGREAWYEQTFAADLNSFGDPISSTAEFMWSDGNYGCDCNRALFLARALGDADAEAAERPCGDGKRYVVTDATWDGVTFPDIIESDGPGKPKGER